MNSFVKFFATGFFTGYIPFAPGTMGSFVGLLFYWFLSSLKQYIYIPTVVAFIFFAIWVSERACVIYQKKDPQVVTIDEIAGLLVTFAFHRFTWPTAIAGFVLFRIFDITKPYPIYYVEKILPGGLGVVMDDVIAGVYANISLWLFIWVLKIIGGN